MKKFDKSVFDGLKLEKENYFEFYGMLNGMLSDEDVKKINDFHNLDLSADDIDFIMKNTGCIKYKNYYNFAFPYDSESEIDKFIEIKEDLSIRLMSNLEMSMYMIKFAFLYDNMNNILEKAPESMVDVIFVNVMLNGIDFEELLSDLQPELKFSKKIKDKLFDLLNESSEWLRFWVYGGRTMNELDFDLILDDMIMESKPRSKNLSNCLDKLSEDGLENISWNHLLLDDDLSNIDVIVNSFNEEVYSMNKSHILRLLDCHEKDVDYSFDVDDFLKGFIFAYKDKGQVKAFIPKEIKDILDSLDLNRFKDEEKNSDDEFSDFLKLAELENMDIDPDFEKKDIIEGYLTMNGVIEKSVLKRLLKENHDINLSISKIDKYVEEMDCAVAGDYYSLFGDDVDESLQIVRMKNEFGNYKPYSIDLSFMDDDFLSDIDDCVSEVFSDEEKSGELGTHILYLMKMGCLNKDTLNQLAKVFNLKESQKRIINDYMKDYKNVISIWPLNGYSLEEVQKVHSEKKVGRNEPCPCGSGKKYKQCCGK